MKFHSTDQAEKLMNYIALCMFLLLLFWRPHTITMSQKHVDLGQWRISARKLRWLRFLEPATRQATLKFTALYKWNVHRSGR